MGWIVIAGVVVVLSVGVVIVADSLGKPLLWLAGVAALIGGVALGVDAVGDWKAHGQATVVAALQQRYGVTPAEDVRVGDDRQVLLELADGRHATCRVGGSLLEPIVTCGADGAELDRVDHP